MKIINKYFGKIELLFLFVFLITLPAVFTTNLIDGALRPRLLSLSVIVLLLVLMFLFRLVRNEYRIILTKTDKYFFNVLALFLFVNIISGFNGVINPKEAVVAVFKEITLATFLFVVYQILRNESKAKDIIVKGILIMTFIYMLIGFVQLMQADFTQFKEAEQYFGYYLRQSIWDVISTLSSPNPFASFAFLSLAFSGYGIINYKKIWRIFSIIVTASSLFFVALIASKASWGALGLAGLIASILLYYFVLVIKPKITGKLLPVWLQVIMLLVPFVGITGGVYLVEKTDIKIVKIAVDKVKQVLQPELCLTEIYNTDKPTSTQTRTLVWGNTLQMTKDNPVLGVGPGQWRIVYAKYGLDGFQHDIRNGVKHFQRPHNDFFWIMGETGFTGILLFVIMYVSILVFAFKSYKENDDIKVRLTQGVFFSVLLGFILVLFVSFPRERITHNVTYLLLFAFILLLGNNKKVEPVSNKFKKTWLGVIASLTVLMGFNLYLSSDLYRSEKSARKIQGATLRKNYMLMMREAKKIEGSYFTMDNFAVPISYYLGIAESNANNNIKKAKHYFTEAEKHHPYHLQTLNNLATSHDLLKDKKTALKIYDKALAISPRYKEALINKSIVLYNLEKYEESFNVIRQIPFNETNPEKYEATLITICRKMAILLIDDLDVKQLEIWFKDENKIKSSFVKIQKQNLDFQEYLLKELGK